MINERFDVISTKENGDSTVVPSVEPVEPAQKTNGVHIESPSASPAKREAKSESHSTILDSPPPKKKRKTSLDADAAYAARLQAEEDARARPTRGGASRKTAPVKKRKKKAKKERVTGSDDSDLEDEENPKPKRNTGFHVCHLTLVVDRQLTSFQKPLNLSSALSSLLDGETQVSMVNIANETNTKFFTQLSRPETTKRLWAYIKANDLQDPNDKRFIICDAKMREVFRQDKVHMFTMTKLVSQQMYNPDE